LDPHPFYADADPDPGSEIFEDPDSGLEFFKNNGVFYVKNIFKKL